MVQNRFRAENIVETKRIYIILLAFLSILGGLVMRLWYLQILKGKDFAVASERNRFREVTRPAPRGLIYDREGFLLLANRPFFDLVVIPQYLQDREKTFSILSELFHIPVEQIEKRLQEASSVPKFVPVRIKRNLTLHEVAMVESNKFFLPGIDVDSAPRRDYVRSEAAHLFGYLGEVTGKELDTLNSQSRDYQYRLGAIIGKQGIEKKFEQYLRGFEGKDFLQVDAFGRLQANSALDFGLYQRKAAKRGFNVFLTIDKDVQEAATEAFRNKNGAVVAIAAQTGEVLAYVSHPNFPLSVYQDGLTAEDWQTLQSNPFKPLLDKATGGAYPPGSTFKIITAIAALEEGVVTPTRTFNCSGVFSLGSGKWRCWRKQGHGPTAMRQAIQKSCDVYFYQISRLLGIDRIAKWGRLFGLGERTGLDLNMELPGIIPSTEWKLRLKGQPWQEGDTINASIGQGYNLATPIQVANMYAAMGTGGRLYRPFLLKKVVDDNDQIIAQEKPFLRRQIEMKPEWVQLIKAGLEDVVNSPGGTGSKAKIPGFLVSGKSGTAQTAALKRTKEVGDLAFQMLDHAWFVGYAPSDNPEIAVVAFSEHDGEHGGTASAPVVRAVIEAYLRKKYPEKFKTLEAEKEKKVPGKTAGASHAATTGTRDGAHGVPAKSTRASDAESAGSRIGPDASGVDAGFLLEEQRVHKPSHRGEVEDEGSGGQIQE